MYTWNKGHNCTRERHRHRKRLGNASTKHDAANCPVCEGSRGGSRQQRSFRRSIVDDIDLGLLCLDGGGTAGAFLAVCLRVDLEMALLAESLAASVKLACVESVIGIVAKHVALEARLMREPLAASGMRARVRRIVRVRILVVLERVAAAKALATALKVTVEALLALALHEEGESTMVSACRIDTVNASLVSLHGGGKKKMREKKSVTRTDDEPPVISLSSSKPSLSSSSLSLLRRSVSSTDDARGTLTS